jgi:hypothetical protein
MRIIKHRAIQAHPFPDKVTDPQGPFSRELLAEPEIVYEYDPAYGEDGSDFLPGATVQNNFKPLKYLTCIVCRARVLETETDNHICEG